MTSALEFLRHYIPRTKVWDPGCGREYRSATKMYSTVHDGNYVDTRNWIYGPPRFTTRHSIEYTNVGWSIIKFDESGSTACGYQYHSLINHSEYCCELYSAETGQLYVGKISISPPRGSNIKSAFHSLC